MFDLEMSRTLLRWCASVEEVKMDSTQGGSSRVYNYPMFF